MRSKQWTAGLLAGAMLIALTACGDATSGSELTVSGEPAAGSTGSNVRISWWGTQVVHEYTLEVCDKFTEKTGIPLEAEYASWADYWQKMNTLSAAGDLPDIMRQDYSYINQYASKGLLEPLDEYIESGAIDCSNVDPMLLEGGRIDGKLYGINVGSNAYTLVYNKGMIEEAGMEAPGPEMTWDDFTAFCKEFHEKTGKYGTTIYELRDPNVFPLLLRAAGESLYDRENAALGYSNDELLVQYFNDVKELQDAGAIPTVDTVAEQTSIENSPFAMGEAATIVVYTDMYPTLCQVMGTELGMTIVPGTGADKAMYAKPSQFLSIPTNSEHKEEAITFINAWINDQDINNILKGRRGVPISSVIAETVGEQMSDAEKAVFDYMDELTQYASPIDPPEPPGAAEVINEFRTQFEKVMFGESNAQTAAENFREKASEYLAAANG